MKSLTSSVLLFLVGAFLLVSWIPAAQQDLKKEDPKKEPGKGEFEKKDFFFGGKGPGGFGGQPRKLVKEFDKDGDGRLNNEERKAAREFLKKSPAGKGPFGKGPGGKGFNPAAMMGKSLLDALDTDKSGSVTKDQVHAGIKQFFTDSDKDKTGFLDETQLAEGFDRFLPRPKGFPGGPGGKDGPPKGDKDGPPKGDKGGPPKEFKGGPPKEGKGGFPKGGPVGGFFIMGLGNMLGESTLRRADQDKDGKVTLKELTAAADKLFADADKGKDGKLDETELGAAVSQVMPVMMGKAREPAKPGPRVGLSDVKSYPDSSLFEPTVLRTFFLEFENKDWEAELADFRNTDVLVPATLTVDGKKYPGVGIHFRGMSSYFGVGPGHKRSLGLDIDFENGKQRLYGAKTLNLLNSNDDPTFMHTVLFSHIARQHIPAPKANFVKVVINGESWGVYVSAQQFNKEFVAENFKTTKGARWKVRGSPGGDSGLAYVSDDIADYKRRYDLKTKDNDADWKALIELCRTLSKTPLDKLEDALKPILDIDGVLWFLALDNALINGDGYWVRASDYSLYRDPKGKFHVIPHDLNETFAPARGFGFGPGFGKKPKEGGGAGPRPGGYDLDPLIGMEDARKPLRSRLLAVPSLKARYLEFVRTIARDSLDWNKLGPLVAQHRALIEKEIEIDTRKLTSYAAFKQAVADIIDVKEKKGGESLRGFADGRRQYLLNHPEIKKLAAASNRGAADAVLEIELLPMPSIIRPPAQKGGSR